MREVYTTNKTIENTGNGCVIAMVIVPLLGGIAAVVTLVIKILGG